MAERLTQTDNTSTYKGLSHPSWNPTWTDHEPAHSDLMFASSVHGREDEALRFLTDESLISRGPLVFILVLMLMVGSTVNLVVTAVFLKRFPASALRSYIGTMSVSDLTATAAGIPLHIHTIVNAYNYSYPFMCNIFFAVTSLSTNMSGFIVVLFAMDRLRRVRCPAFKEMDRLRSYYQVAIVVTLAVLVTVPFIPMYGVYTHPSFSGYPARMCWVNDAYRDSVYPLVYKGVLGLTFCVSLVLIVYSYSMIGYKIYVLTEDIKAEVLYLLAHPPPPSRFMYIYADDPAGSRVHKVSEIRAKLANIAEVLEEPRGSASAVSAHKSHASILRIPLTFAERLHAPRPYGHMTDEELGEGLTASHKSSRIKKISDAIQNFFSPVESESSSSSTDSSFISVRANCSFIKTGETPVRSIITNENFPKQASKESPSVSRIKKIPYASDFVLDMSVTSSSTDDVESTGATTNEFIYEFGNTNRNITGPSPDNNQQGASTKEKKNNVGTVKPEELSREAGSPSVKPEGHGGEAGSPSQSPYVTTDPVVTKPHTTTEYSETVNKGQWNRDPIPDATSEQVKDPPQTRVSTQITRQLGLESLATLDHLQRIKKNSRNTMITLTALYILTWLPNLFSRVFVSRPPNLCKELADCWTNGPSYAVCSVFINSTVNAFFYCFGSVHFRKQVKLFFQPCRAKLCPKRRKRKVVRIIRKKKVKEVTIKPPELELQPEQEPEPGQEPEPQKKEARSSTPADAVSSPIDNLPAQSQTAKDKKDGLEPETARKKDEKPGEKSATAKDEKPGEQSAKAKDEKPGEKSAK